MRKLAADQLSSYKVPQAILSVDEQDIPRTASAKVIKGKLAESIMDQLDW